MNRTAAATPSALRLCVKGRVQGVGFRPFVAREAIARALSGWVRNTPQGVEIHLQGPLPAITSFRQTLQDRPPAAAVLTCLDSWPVDLEPALDSFQILPSLQPEAAHHLTVEITPDLAVCHACLVEFQTPGNRRAGFALNACTDCGPRFTLQQSAPFDRACTSMAVFTPCAFCRQEYENPHDRRFHAQNVACPACGPRVWLEPNTDDADTPAITRAAALIAEGKIVAVQGVGGFHLFCDATNQAAVTRLRDRKHRPRKPLAVMFGDVDSLMRHVLLEPKERAALEDPAAPIVLAQRSPESTLAPAIAPGLQSVGVLRGYTPLHHLLLHAAATPLVATSANASDEPMPIEAAEARQNLSETADAFLLHDRPILRPADDSVVRLIGRHAVPLRVGRGLAPVKVETPRELPPLVATGAHLKAAIALSRGREIWLGPHIGDLGTPSVRTRYRHVLEDLLRLFGVEPQTLACDLHPDYFTTQLAQASGLPVLSVQHHHAHVASCLAEHGGRDEPVLGIAWDGTGFGADGGIWGGEFLRVEGPRWQRVGSLWPFPLVGGDRAARQPRQSAACVQFAAGLGLPSDRFTATELKILKAALAGSSSRLAVTCTSAGRLFDAWASLLGLCHQTAYEGEAALLLEEAADPAETGHFPTVVVDEPPASHSEQPASLPIGWNPSPVSCRRLDWRPWVAETQAGLARGIPAPVLAARFHNSLAAGTLEVARHLGIETVVLTGGCFQNRILSQGVETLLTRDGFRVLTHRRIPAGDGGLAVGQLWAATLSIQESSAHVSGNPR